MQRRVRHHHNDPRGRLRGHAPSRVPSSSTGIRRALHRYRAAPTSKERTVIGTIIGAIVVGLIVGVLARLVMPGKQNIGVIMTVLLGAIGSFLGTWASYKLGYSNQNGGFK